jgi:predicted ester cyclase
MNKNEKFIYDFFHTLWLNHDISVIDEYFADDVLIEGVVGLALGTEGKKKIAKSWFAAFPKYHGKIERVISCGDHVSLRWSSNSRHEGEFCGIPATGKCFNYMGDCCFHIQNQQIVEYRGASTIADAFVQEGFQLTLPPKHINYSALINAARYINGIRFNNKEVELLALKFIGASKETISAVLRLPLQNIEDLLEQILNKLGACGKELTELFLVEGTTNIFTKIADIVVRARQFNLSASTSNQ